MSFRFPDWPTQRLLAESVAAYNLRNPDAPLEVDSADWAQLYAVVLAFIRHNLCNYDQACLEGADREKLRKAIHTAAKRQYLWLRADTDPREKTASTEQQGPKHYKVLNDASAQLADLVSVRAHLLEARRREKDKAQRESIDQKLKTVEAVIKQRRSLFARFPDFNGKSSPFIIWDHPTPYYSFGCRLLAPNYIEAVGIKCPKCGKAVMRTKRPLDLGAGFKLACLSCECLSIAVNPDLAYPNVEAWTTLLEEEETSCEY